MTAAHDVTRRHDLVGPVPPLLEPQAPVGEQRGTERR